MLKKLASFLFSVIMLVYSFSFLTASAATAQAFDTVLVLDVSGSMYDDLSDMRSAAMNACVDILNANPDNRIAIVSFGTYAEIECDFTGDYAVLETAISDMYDDGVTNLYDACVLAKQLVESPSSVNNIKNIIIMTDGFPCEGEYSYSGRYNSMFPMLVSTSSYAPDMLEYANSVYDYVSTEIHPIANVYTSGFFNFNDSDPSTLDDDEQLAVQLVKDLANAKSYFPTSASVIFDDVIDDVLAEDDVTEAESVTEETTSYGLPDDTFALTPIAPDKNGGTSTGMMIAVGSVSAVGLGGLIALMIYLLTRKPKTPIPPVAPPVLLPIMDDDDDEEEDAGKIINDGYVAPDGIGAFAVGAGAGMENVEYSGFASATIYGISGSYRNSSIKVKDNETIVIGRDPSSCNLIITDDTSKVSRIHCSISYDSASGNFTVIDRSKNGISTKAMKLPYNIPKMLPPGTEIQLADSSNIFRLG